MSPIFLSRSSHLHTTSSLSAAQSQSQSRLCGGSTDQETLTSSPPPLLLLDSPAQLPSPYTPSTISVPATSHHTLTSFPSPLLSSSAHLHSPVVSHSKQANQLGASKEGSNISSTFINLSPSIPLGSTKPTISATCTNGPPSAHGDFLSFNSPALRLPTPLVDTSPLQPQRQSPLLHLSSSLQQYSPLTSTKGTPTSGNPLQSNLSSPLGLLPTSGQISISPSHTGGERLLFTTHTPHTAAHKVSSLTTARTMGASPSLTTTPIIDTHGDTPSVIATPGISIGKTPSGDLSTTPVSGIFTTPTHTASFLLTSQPPTPYLHADLSSSEEGEREDELPSSPLLHSSVDGEILQTGEKEESFGTVADNDTDLRPSEEKLNSIPPGLKISATQDGLVTLPLSPSTHVVVSTSPQSGQLIDFSATSDEDWRPLDVSGDHLSSSPPQPPYHTTLDHSLKGMCRAYTLFQSEACKYMYYYLLDLQNSVPLYLHYSFSLCMTSCIYSMYCCPQQ